MQAAVPILLIAVAAGVWLAVVLLALGAFGIHLPVRKAVSLRAAIARYPFPPKEWANRC